MLSFMTDELVWAIQRERQEEARKLRPHVEPKPQSERAVLGHDERDGGGLWLGRTLRGGAHG